jgi:alpha-1,2-mannosyltransferase
VATGLGLVAFGVYAATATWVRPISIDVRMTALEAWQLARTGTPWLEQIRPSLNPEGLPFVVLGQLVTTEDGHLVTTRTPGVVLAAVPAYVMARTPTAQLWPSTLVAVLVLAVAVAMMFLALDALVRRPVAIGATLAFAFATPTWSVSADGLWPHTITQAGIAAAACASARGRWTWVGVALSVAVLARAHVAAIALVLGLGVALWQRRPAIALKVGLPTAVALAVVVGANAAKYGAPSLAGGRDYVTSNLTMAGSEAAQSYLANLAGFLFSADRGVLLWTPVLLVLAPSAIRAVRTAPDWVVCLALGGLLYTAIQVKINAYTGGAGFYGYRLGLELITCLVPLLAVAWQGLRSDFARVLVIVLLYLQAAVVATGALVEALWVDRVSFWSSSILLAAEFAPLALGGFTALAMLGAVLTVRAMGRPDDESDDVRRAEAVRS